MFTRTVSMPSPRSSKPSSPSRDGMSSSFEQREAFTTWWEEWVRRIQRNRANPTKLTLTYEGHNRASPLDRSGWQIT